MTPTEQRTLLGHVQAVARALDDLLEALEGVVTHDPTPPPPEPGPVPEDPPPYTAPETTTAADPEPEPEPVWSYGTDAYGHGPYGGTHG